MDESHPSNVISLIDIGLSADEHYVQFVPPATFGVIYNSATTDIQVVLANGERSELRRTADKIYALRGLIALRRREERDLDLGTELEDDIIRHILHTFGSLEKLREAVRKFCPLRENAEVLADSWAPCVFPDDGQEPIAAGRVAWNENSLASGPHFQPGGVDEKSSSLEPLTPFSDSSAYSTGEQMAIGGLGPFSVSGTLSAAHTQPYPVSSLQELEEFTLPVPFDDAHATSDHFIYSAELQVDGTQLANQRMTLEQETDSFRLSPVDSPLSLCLAKLSADRMASNLPHSFVVNKPPFITDNKETRPCSPGVLTINPFCPPIRFSSPVHKRPHDRNGVRTFEVATPNRTFSNPGNDVNAEIQALAGMTVLKTRQTTMATKLELVAKVINGLGLTWTDEVVGQSFNAIESAIAGYVSRIRKYFLAEGMRYSQFDKNMNTPEYRHVIIPPTHHCDTCNACLSTFFAHTQLMDVVDVQAILSEPQLRQSVVNLYQGAVQLAAKSTWDGNSKEGTFEQGFNALDSFTARSDFPRRGEVMAGYPTSSGDMRKRRKIGPKVVDTPSSM